MVKWNLPDGMDHSLEDYRLPDMESTFRLFGAHWRSVNPEWRYPEHEHPLFEINMVVEGTQEMTIGRKTVEQRAGDIVLIRPGVRHASRVLNDAAMTYFCLHFDMDDPLFRQLMQRTSKSVYPRTTEESQRLQRVLRKLIDLTQKKTRLHIRERMQLHAATYELFSVLGDSLSKDEALNTEHSPNMLRIASRMADAIHHMVETSDRDGLSEENRNGIYRIARSLGYSPSYCNRIFRNVYGMSPRQYWTAVKLRQAKLLLLDQERTVENVAESLGYKDISHFSRQFKRWTGESPSDYRERYQ